jgi:hypothetical protein
MNFLGLYFLVFLIVLLICLLGDISKLKKGFKVKVTGHVKGIGDDATMEDNTPQQLAIDLALHHLEVLYPYRSYQHILDNP